MPAIPGMAETLSPDTDDMVRVHTSPDTLLEDDDLSADSKRKADKIKMNLAERQMHLTSGPKKDAWDSGVTNDAIGTLFHQVQSTWLITPNSKFARRWDLVVALALLYTGAFTPWEVAFMESKCKWHPLFVWNRIIDITFLFDMGLQFVLIKEVDTAAGIVTVKNHKELRENYLRGWFFIDLVSIFPFDFIGCEADSDSISELKIFRVIRLLRLLKLLRLVRASRMLARWESSLSLSTHVRGALTAFGGLLLASHWIACLWGMVGRQLSADGHTSWIDALQGGKGGDNGGMNVSEDEEDGLNVYFASLHFATMTITSIGYGDISPMQPSEYLICIFCQCFGGIMWAFVIGIFSSLMATANPAQIRFRQTMDELNHMMDARGLDSSTRINLRVFFMAEKNKQEMEAQQGLLDRMSPALRAEIAGKVSGRAVRSVWYVKNCSDVFVASLGLALNIVVYAQGENINLPTCLCLVNRGLVVRGGAVKGRFKCFGEDFVLGEKLRVSMTALALTFVELLCIDGPTFRDLLDNANEADYKMVRKGIVKLTLIRGVKWHAAIELEKRGVVQEKRSSGMFDFAPSASMGGIKNDANFGRSSMVSMGNVGNGGPGVSAEDFEDLRGEVRSTREDIMTQFRVLSKELHCAAGSPVKRYSAYHPRRQSQRTSPDGHPTGPTQIPAPLDDPIRLPSMPRQAFLDLP